MLPADASALQQQIRAEQADQRRRWMVLTRLRLSHPQRVSAGISAIRSRQPSTWDCSTVCEFQGPVLQVEPGINGLQFAAGHAVVFGETGRTGPWISNVMMGYGWKAAWLRTWGDADLSPTGQDLVGLEGEFTVIQVHFSLGLFRALDGDARNRWSIAGGIGWGF